MKKSLIVFACSLVLVTGCKHKVSEDSDKPASAEAVNGDCREAKGSGDAVASPAPCGNDRCTGGGHTTH